MQMVSLECRGRVLFVDVNQIYTEKKPPLQNVWCVRLRLLPHYAFILCTFARNEHSNHHYLIASCVTRALELSIRRKLFVSLHVCVGGGGVSGPLGSHSQY